MKLNKNIPLSILHEHLKENYYSKFTRFMPKNHCHEKYLMECTRLSLNIYCMNPLYQHKEDFKTGAYILAIPRDLKRAKFGRHFDAINCGLGSIFELAIPANRKKGIANGYRLSKQLIAVLEQFEMEYEQGNIRIPTRKPRALSTPIMSKSERTNEDNTVTMVNAKETHRNHGLPTVITAQLDSLWTVITVGRKILPNVFDGMTTMHYMICNTLDNIRSGLCSELERKVFDDLVGDAMGHKEINEVFQRVQRIKASALCMHATATACNGIPMRYEETKNGRLYALSDINLQNAPRIVRKAALAGCFDIDLANCHYAIVFNLSDKLGVMLKAIQYYLDNKTAVRNAIAKDLDLTVDDVKTALLSMIFGASFRENAFISIDDRDKPTAMSKLLGEKMAAFKKHPLVKGLVTDIKKGANAILDYYENRTKRGFIVNAFGSEMSMKDSRTKTGRRKLSYIRKALSFLLQGQERVILDIVIRNLDGTKILLLQHDGLTYKDEVSRTELDRIEADILTETGLVMNIGDAERLTTIVSPCIAQNAPTFNIAA